MVYYTGVKTNNLWLYTTIYYVSNTLLDRKSSQKIISFMIPCCVIKFELSKTNTKGNMGLMDTCFRIVLSWVGVGGRGLK